MLFIYFTISNAIFYHYGFKFSFYPTGFKNSLLHALIKHLKYLQIQNRCSRTENKFT